MQSTRVQLSGFCGGLWTMVAYCQGWLDTCSPQAGEMVGWLMGGCVRHACRCSAPAGCYCRGMLILLSPCQVTAPGQAL